MIVSSSGGTTRRSPSTNLAPPVPPVSTTIMRRSARSLQRPWLRLVSSSAEWIYALLVPETPDKPAAVVATETLSFVCAVRVPQGEATPAQAHLNLPPTE